MGTEEQHPASHRRRRPSCCSIETRPRAQGQWGMAQPASILRSAMRAAGCGWRPKQRPVFRDLVRLWMNVLLSPARSQIIIIWRDSRRPAPATGETACTTARIILRVMCETLRVIRSFYAPSCVRPSLNPAPTLPLAGTLLVPASALPTLSSRASCPHDRLLNAASGP